MNSSPRKPRQFLEPPDSSYRTSTLNPTPKHTNSSTSRDPKANPNPPQLILTNPPYYTPHPSHQLKPPNTPPRIPTWRPGPRPPLPSHLLQKATSPNLRPSPSSRTENKNKLQPNQPPTSCITYIALLNARVSRAYHTPLRPNHPHLIPRPCLTSRSAQAKAGTRGIVQTLPTYLSAS